ncbi:MAG TPA: VWA domain-containing protein [Candidatus Methylomirabilis sp.]|nr:VWA domain-containing protein [Candidatus Methylomirabilis sp.]
MNPLGKRCTLSLFLAAFAAAPLLAQAPPTNDANKRPQTAASAIKVETRVVLLDVVVTDHKGETIPNLHEEDFQVAEDGKPQTISAFEEHRRETSAPVSLPALPPNVYTNIQPVKSGDSVNVLLIDLLNTQPWFQKGVCTQAIKYLKTVPPGTRLAIFTLNTRQLRLVRGFTTDFSGLSVALDDRKSGVTPESSWLNPTPSRQAAELRGLDAMIMMQASPAAVGAVSDYLGQEAAFRMGNRSDLTLQAFQHLARYLSGIPARKNVIWLADTFPISFLSEDKVHTPRHQERVQQTSDMLTAAQVAIYPVSARGLVFDGEFDVPLDAPGEKMLDEFATSQIAAETIAQETGGRAFYNTNGLDAAMGKAIDEGSHYYTLAYSPTNARNDGKYCSIEVKLHDGDYKLSYRRGYYADKPESPQTAEKGTEDPLIPLVGFGMPNFDQITYRVRAVPVQPQPAPNALRAGLNTEMKGPLVRYGADIAVSLQDFALETTPDGVRHGRIEAMLVAYDREGKIVNIAKRASRFALKPEDYTRLQTKGLPLYLEIDIPPGDVYLRTGVYDWGSGNAGTLGFPLNTLPRTAAVPK